MIKFNWLFLILIFSASCGQTFIEHNVDEKQLKQFCDKVIAEPEKFEYYLKRTSFYNGSSPEYINRQEEVINEAKKYELSYFGTTPEGYNRSVIYKFKDGSDETQYLVFFFTYLHTNDWIYRYVQIKDDWW